MTFAPHSKDETGVLPTETVFGVSGLEFIQGIISGRFPAPPISPLMCMRLVEASEGRAVFKAEPDETLMNPIGTIHGGFAMTILDSCMACSIHTTLSAGEAYTTAEAKVNLVRAILPSTGVITAQGTIIHRGRRLATAEGKLIGPDGKLLAHGSTTCAIMPAPAAQDGSGPNVG